MVGVALPQFLKHTGFAVQPDLSPPSAVRQSYLHTQVPSAPVDSLVLGVPLQTQGKSNWCWAAVVSALSYYYREPYASPQCEVATRFLKLQCCPPNNQPRPEDQNGTYEITRALGGNFAIIIPDQIDFPRLQDEIRNRRPVCLIIDWDGRGGHVVIASGFLDTGDVVIDDPSVPRGTGYIPGQPYAWASLCNGFGDGGKWVMTVLTKKSTAP